VQQNLSLTSSSARPPAAEEERYIDIDGRDDPRCPGLQHRHRVRGSQVRAPTDGETAACGLLKEALSGLQMHRRDALHAKCILPY
jgi:hypothetical protein